ncbi:MAG: hypothetical protein MR691_08320 [Clostridium sp.]|nr:hypothetical protein [Clostridium sp.]
MTNEIVFTCNSINNKNVRGSELKILRKLEKQLCFEFGENEKNVKIRYYKDLKTLNEDFEKVKKIKEKLEKENDVSKKEISKDDSKNIF